jgi:hypothetical protein
MTAIGSEPKVQGFCAGFKKLICTTLKKSEMKETLKKRNLHFSISDHRPPPIPVFELNRCL